MRSPRIDGRDTGRIIEQLLELAPYYVPEWNRLSERDPANAVIRIFAGQYVDTLERLNQVPGKNFLAFLSKLGLSLLPATQAQVPVTFRLSAGVKEAVLIPERTQVAAAATDGGKPVVFETTKPMLATASRITDLLAVTKGAAAIYAAPLGFADQAIAPLWAVTAASANAGDRLLLLDNAKGLAPGDLLRVGDKEYAEVAGVKGQTVTLVSALQYAYDPRTEVNRVTVFKLFEGRNQQEQAIYMAEDNLLHISAHSSFRLWQDTSGDSIYAATTASRQLRWQYWNGAWKDAAASEDGWLRAEDAAWPLDRVAVNGERNRWVRGLLVPEADGLPVTVSAISDAPWHIEVKGDVSPPDLLFSNNNPVEPLDGGSGAFYLFGANPRTGDALYVSSRESLSKRGGLVTLTFLLADGAGSPEAIRAIFTSEVSWEYWNGTGWLRWERKEITINGTSSIQLTFQNSHDIATNAVQGQENYWIRCRLTAMSEGGIDVPGKKLQIRDLALSYSAQAPIEQATVYRSLRFRDWSTGERWDANDPLDQAQALYIGFDKAPLRGPISLYLSLLDQTYSPDRRPVVEWQYYAERRGGPSWVKLDANDGTEHLTRSGCLQFVGLPDWTEADLFGRSRYWLRAVDTQGAFQPADSDEAITVPAPILQGIYRNTVLTEQTETMKDEVVGSSRGMANAAFMVSRVPVLSEELYIDELSSISDRERQTIRERGVSLLEEKDEQGMLTRCWVKWSCVDTLSEAGPDDRYYTIDRTSGQIRFGDGIHGRIPPIGTNNVKLSYRCGGGQRGNVEAGSITMLKSSIAYVDGVVNPDPSAGGFDTEDVDRAAIRGPQLIRHRFRAVTAADYESLAYEAARGIARVKCLPNVNERGETQPGRITLVVVPQSTDPLPRPSAALKQTIERYLQDRCANAVSTPSYLHIRGPDYAEVTIHAVLVTQSFEQVAIAEREALLLLQSYLHPLTGGPQLKGWDFGNLPALSDLYVLLGGVRGLEYVDRLLMVIRDGEGNEVTITPSESHPLTFSPQSLIYSGLHQVIVRSLGR